MINVLINGCNGKMGQEIATLIHSSHSFFFNRWNC